MLDQSCTIEIVDGTEDVAIRITAAVIAAPAGVVVVIAGIGDATVPLRRDQESADDAGKGFGLRIGPGWQAQFLDKGRVRRDKG